MTDDHSLDDEQKLVVQPEEGNQEELSDRQKLQLEGWQSLVKGHRAVIQTALKEPTQANLEALRKLQETEPKFARAVLKDYGYEDLGAYEKAIKKDAPPKEEFMKMIEEFEQQKTVQSTKSQIETQFASLPEAIRDKAQQEFKDLTEGRNLTPSQLTDFAKKSITLANASTGSNFRLNLGALASNSLSSTSSTIATDEIDKFIAEKAKTDPFYAIVAGK